MTVTTLIVGKTTTNQWKRMMNLPAPWGEIEVPSTFTVTFPTEELRKVKNIKALAKLYRRAFKFFVELMGTSRIHNHERMVFDKQVSAGAHCY